MSESGGDISSADLTLPSPKEILEGEGFDDNQSNDLQSITELSFKSRAAQGEADWIRLKALQDHYAHKGKWSFFLMGCMASMILFQSMLLWRVGVGDWDFKAYEWLLPALLVQNLGQIIALAFVVVKSLFK